MRKTREIKVGGVSVGGGAPVSVQTMANVDPHDAAALSAHGRGIVALVGGIAAVSHEVADCHTGQQRKAYEQLLTNHFVTCLPLCRTKAESVRTRG